MSPFTEAQQGRGNDAHSIGTDDPSLREDSRNTIRRRRRQQLASLRSSPQEIARWAGWRRDSTDRRGLAAAADVDRQRLHTAGQSWLSERSSRPTRRALSGRFRRPLTLAREI